MEIVVVNSNGQVTLPAKERRKYGFEPGTHLMVVEGKGGLVLQKARIVTESVFDELKRLADAKGLTQAELVKLSREVGRKVYSEEYPE